MNQVNKQLLVLIILLIVQVCGGCASGSYNYVKKVPDYENIYSSANSETYYVARNIKAYTEDSLPKFTFEILKLYSQEGVHYYVTKEKYPSTCGNFQFQPDVLKFLVDGKLMSLKQELVYVTKDYDFKNSKNIFYKSTIDQLKDIGFMQIEKYYFEISEEQIREIASGESVVVFYRMTEGIEHGKLFKEDIERFQIFLVKYVDKWK